MVEKLVRTCVMCAFLLVVAAFSGCGTHLTSLTESQDGSTLSLKPGDGFTVKLPSNPTTGYSWQVLEIDSGILEMVGEPVFQPDSNEQGLVGAGGTETLHFEAKRSGESSLSLGYARPWEADEPPLKTFTIHLVVE